MPGQNTGNEGGLKAVIKNIINSDGSMALGGTAIYLSCGGWAALGVALIIRLPNCLKIAVDAWNENTRLKNEEKQSEQQFELSKLKLANEEKSDKRQSELASQTIQRAQERGLGYTLKSQTIGLEANCTGFPNSQSVAISQRNASKN